jgi:Membrane domain of glycerophosphoryl diester phosphodiesterase
MSAPLRPMTTGEILDRTFNLYRRNFLLFAGIAVVPPALMLVVHLIQTSMVATAGHPRTAGAGLAGGFGMIVGWIAYLIGIAVAQAATVFAVSAVHLERSTTIAESYGRVKGRYGRVVWVLVQSWLRAFWPMILIIAAGFAIAAALGKGTAAAVTGLVMGLGIVVGGVVGLVLFLKYALAVPACVLEDITASEAIKRSVILSRGSRRQIFVIYFLMGVINYIVMFVFLIPATYLAALVAKGSPAVATLSAGLATFLAGALAGPIATIALSLVYFDQRVRKEAFDIQLMMAAVDGTPLVGAQAASAG